MKRICSECLADVIVEGYYYVCECGCAFTVEVTGRSHLLDRPVEIVRPLLPEGEPA